MDSDPYKKINLLYVEEQYVYVLILTSLTDWNDMLLFLARRQRKSLQKIEDLNNMKDLIFWKNTNRTSSS